MNNIKKENEISGFISVRTSSSRLPKKCFLPFGTNETVLSHVIKRTKYFGIDPIICTSTDKSDNEIENLAKKMKIKIFRGSLKNKLKRWADCADYFEIDAFHSIDADDPFFDGKLIKKSMQILYEKNLDCVCPTESSSNGSASVGYSLTKDIVKKAIKNLSDEDDTEMMWYFLEKVRFIKMETLSDRSDKQQLRLTLDYEEDYWLLLFIQRLFGTFASRNEINNLFSSNPDLAKINLFRNDQWKKAQTDKKI
tara:strand:- start:2920 stop:3675 length:756 start_codon:yes stop_codon:yes gene_type:complete